jgi:hypothetical protein
MAAFGPEIDRRCAEHAADRSGGNRATAAKLTSAP